MYKVFNVSCNKKIDGIEPGMILELLGQDYQKDYQNYSLVFKIIGNPAYGTPSVNIEYK